MAFKTFNTAERFAGFNLPTGILPTFQIDTGFPKGFTMPSNKQTWGANLLPWDVQDINGKNCLLRCGYTHVDHNTNADGGSIPSKGESMHLLGDSAWADLTTYESGFDPSKWHDDQILNFAGARNVVLLDYEHMGDGPQSTGAMRTRMAEMAWRVKNYQNSNLACWGQGLVNPVPMYQVDTGTGAFIPARNSTSAAQWVNMYSPGGGTYTNSNSRTNPLVSQGGLHISNPFFYHTAYMVPEVLYDVIANVEISKVTNPSMPCIPAIWIQIEHVDGYQIETADIIKPNGTKFRKYMKLQAPPECVYGDALWCLFVADGYYDFDTGAIATADPAYTSAEFSNEPLPRRMGRVGVERTCWYPNKYFGFYNYRHLANWQIAQEPFKSTLEGTINPVMMPEYRVSSGANIWRTGNNVFPSWAQLNNEPLIRYKINDAGTKVIFLAQNPYNEGTQTVNIRNVANTWDTTITLDGGYPLLGYINL